MTTFQDGPAKGQTLMLKRAAMFLRVVQNAEGKWDALDQPEDTPAMDEKLFAYEITGKPYMVHLNCGRGKGSGFYPGPSYRFVTNQPTDSQMRQASEWDAWCKRQPVKELL